MKGYRAILFDAAGTLLEPYPSVGAVYADAARAHGAGVDADALDRAFREVWQAQAAQGDGGRGFASSEVEERAWWAAVVRDTFVRAGAWDAIRERFDAYFEDVFRRFESAGAWRVYEDVRPALEALAECGLRLGVVSNWDSRLPGLLERLDLAGYFSAVITSAGSGWSKPDRRIFEAALKRLGVSAAHALHVGDSPGMDVEAARNAGLGALLIDRDAAARDGVISSLTQIVPRLAR